MVSTTAALFVFSLMTLTLGRPSVMRSEMVVRDEHPSIPKGYSAGGDAPLPGATLRLTLAMPQTNISGLHSALMDVSDPSSENYGRHLSKAEVQRLVAPSQDSVKAVNSWLSKNGISTTAASPAGDMVTLSVSVEQANSLLGANFKNYVHDQTNTTMVRTLSYSLPASVQDHVAYIYPTTQFVAPVKPQPATPVEPLDQPSVTPSKRRLHSRAALDIPDTLCGKVATPQCLQKMYNVPSSPATAPGNSIAVSSFGDENALASDLESFLSQARPDIRNGTFTTTSVDGFKPPNEGTSEASLDVQYMVGVATNVPASLVTIDTSDNGAITMDKFIDMANFLLKMDNPPLVFSTSYGFNEPSNSAGFTQLAQTLCNAYAQLGARGVSVIYASGDSGVAGTFMNNPANCTNSPFVPTFPASCPYVTTVGSTQGQGPETAASFTSGGFSNIFPRPSYQDAAVERYLDAQGSTYKGRYNASGRAYPDVATQGVRFAVQINGELVPVSGTSASAPTFAAIVSLLNDQLLGAGRSALGFLNPMLYQQGAAAMNDITSGSNPGCGTNGFEARAGWDPVTGLGTPDFNRLIKAITGHPSTLAQTSKNWGTKADASSLSMMLSLVLVSLVVMGL